MRRDVGGFGPTTEDQVLRDIGLRLTIYRERFPDLLADAAHEIFETP